MTTIEQPGEKRLSVLPCPFCGGEAIIEPHTYPSGDVVYGLICDDCSCQTAGNFTTPEYAIERWNRRASTPVSGEGEWVLVPRKPTLDMKRAANKRVAISTPDGTWALALDEAERAYSAMLAAAPAHPIEEEGVRVKPLEWQEEDTDGENAVWWSATSDETNLDYEVRLTPSGKVRSRSLFSGWEDFEGTVDEAKAAAQADFNARILSALAHNSQEGGE